MGKSDTACNRKAQACAVLFICSKRFKNLLYYSRLDPAAVVSDTDDKGVILRVGMERDFRMGMSVGGIFCVA